MPSKDAPLLVCADCGETARLDDLLPRAWGWHSVITDTLGSRVTCDPCYRWRAARGLTFDPRNRRELEQAAA
jgi:hypothetical protein